MPRSTRRAGRRDADPAPGTGPARPRDEAEARPVGTATTTGLRAAATRGAFWTVTRTWGSRVMSMVIFAVLGRYLDAGAFGTMALAVAIVEFGRLVLVEGAARAVVQIKDLDEAHLDTAFWISVAGGATFSVLGVVLAGPLASALGQPELGPVLRVLALSFVLISLITTQQAMLQRALDFRGIAVRVLVSTLVGGVVGVTLAVTGAGVWALVAQYLSQATVAVLVQWRVTTWRPRLRFSRSRFKRLVTYGLGTQAIHVLGYLGQRGDEVLIGIFLGPVSLGYFAVSQRVLQIVMEVFSSTINAVAFPVFSRMQEDPGRIRETLHTVTRTSSVVAFPALLTLTVLAPEIIRTLFGHRWGESAEILQITAAAGVSYTVTFFSRSILLALGRAGTELGWVAFFVATKAVAFTIGYHWGLDGVAWAIVIHAFTLLPLRIWLLDRVTPIAPWRYASGFLGPLVASTALVASLIVVRAWFLDGAQDLVVVAVCGLVGVVVYLSVLASVAPATVRELVGHARSVRL